MAKALGEVLAVDCAYSQSQKSIVFRREAFRKFSRTIAPYVHSSMQYKILPEHRGEYNKKVESSSCCSGSVILPARILEKRKASPTQMRKPRRYDLTVEGAHTYLVGGNSNGIAVHNSPEVTPGGRALKFWSSIRLEVKRWFKSEINGESGRIGHDQQIKTVKNKTFVPYREARVPIHYLKGIRLDADLKNAALAYGVVKSTQRGIVYHGSIEELKGKFWATEAEFYASVPVAKVRKEIMETALNPN